MKHFLSYFILNLILLNAYGQRQHMPYNIRFDENFKNTGLDAAIYPDWLANEAANGRIYHENNSIILQNLGTFTPSLFLYFTPDANYNSLQFELGAKQNGSGTRPSTAELRLWHDERLLYRTIIGPNQGFENRTIPAETYLLQIEKSLFMQANYIEVRSLRGEGSGTSAAIVFKAFTIDDTPPPFALTGISALSPFVLALDFNSSIAQPAFTASSIAVNDTIKANTYSNTNNGRTLEITFDRPLPMYTEALLRLPDITNTSVTQVMEAAVHPFTVMPNLNVGDIVLNELLLQPTTGQLKPLQTGIPQAVDAQFIELFNNSDWDIQTDFISINQQKLPKSIWSRQSFLLIAHAKWQDHWQQFTPTLTLEDFTLSPKEGKIQLYFKEKLLDSLQYNEQTYGDLVKSTGGWSLERKTKSACHENINWAASESVVGATPGNRNSVFTEHLAYQLPPPVIQVKSPSQLSLQFDATLTDFSFNEFHKDLGEAMIDYIDGKKVGISFANTFEIGKPYTLKFSTKLSCFEAWQPSQEIAFGHGSAPEFGDVVINEIYHNPQNNARYPAQFIELYNKSNAVVDVAHLFLASHRQTVQLPERQLMPGEYMILSPAAQHDYGQNHAIVHPWPTMNTSDGYIAIKNVLGEVLHEIDFNRSWYRHHIKSQGGYSLELIDSNFPCTGAANWKASDNSFGATPGYINSVKASNPDLSKFKLNDAIAFDSLSIALNFSKTLHPLTAENLSFTLSPKVDVAKKFQSSQARNTLILKLATPLKKGEIYQLTIRESMSCHGEKYATRSAIDLSVCLPAEHGDIAVNEVLSQPKDGSEKFVEIKNISDKYINLKDWLLARIIDESPQQHTKLSEVNLAIAPGEVLAFTENAEAVRNSYPHSVVPENLIQLSGMPNFPQTSGQIAIFDIFLNEIDHMTYHEHMHHPMLSSTHGVSLERASGFGDNAVWVSAPAAIGFASPGAVNASHKNFAVSEDDLLMLSPKVFNPNSTSFNTATVHINLPDNGYLASISIYTKRGQLIKRLCQQANVSREAAYLWYGDMENGSLASIGEYIVLAEFTHPSGEKLQAKKVIAISPQP